MYYLLKVSLNQRIPKYFKRKFCLTNTTFLTNKDVINNSNCSHGPMAYMLSTYSKSVSKSSKVCFKLI